MTQFNSQYSYGNSISFKSYLSKTFGIMALGLALSGVVAFLFSTVFVNVLYRFPTLTMVALIAELVVAFYFTARLQAMSREMAWTCFILYAVLTGFTLSVIVYSYTLASVIFAFISTVVLFGCMAIIGNTTRFDLTKISSYLFAGLMALIISSLLNMLFFKSSGFNYLLSVAGVIIFLVIVAFDVQKLQRFYDLGSYDALVGEKMMIMGAFQLYLDFINIFIRVLTIFGRRRE